MCRVQCYFRSMQVIDAGIEDKLWSIVETTKEKFAYEYESVSRQVWRDTTASRARAQQTFEHVIMMLFLIAPIIMVYPLRAQTANQRAQEMWKWPLSEA